MTSREAVDNMIKAGDCYSTVASVEHLLSINDEFYTVVPTLFCRDTFRTHTLAAITCVYPCVI